MLCILNTGHITELFLPRGFPGSVMCWFSRLRYTNNVCDTERRSRRVYHTHEKVGLWRRLPEVLLDVLGLVGDHADERVQLDDCHTQVDQIHRVSQQSPQGWNKVCRGMEIWVETLSENVKYAISMTATMSIYCCEMKFAFLSTWSRKWRSVALWL